MPTRPEMRKYYGPAWRAYRAELIRIHGTRCTVCHRLTPKYLNLTHEQRDPRTSSVVRMRCPTCHGRYDALWNRALARRTIARRTGQLWLLPEVEWAAAPSDRIPRAVLNLAQGVLFT